MQRQVQQPQGAPPTGTAGMEKQFQHQHLNMRGFDHVETFLGGEDQWQNWVWKVKTTVPGMNGELADILDAAVADGVRNLEEILQKDASVDAKKKKTERQVVQRVGEVDEL